MKATMDGNAEIGYTADVGMTDVYAGTGSFKDYKAGKSNMVHTWYAYPMESFMAVYAPNASKYSSWGDFSGKPVFFTPAGYMNWLNFIRIFKALGYEFKHVQIMGPPRATLSTREPSSALLLIPPPAAHSPLTGAKPNCAPISRSSIPVRMKLRN